VKGKISNWNGLPLSKSLFHSGEERGLPIGNLTSQLFSNVYLNDFDHYAKDTLKLEYYGRYVDDFVIVHQSREYLKEVQNKIDHFLTDHLQICLHPHKVYLQHYAKGVAFLGTYIKPNRIYIGKRAKCNFFHALRDTDKLLCSEVQLRESLPAVRASINSYLGIMRHYNTFNLRKKMLLSYNHQFFKYGVLADKLLKFIITKNR
jgi:hypothetical protein